MQSRSITLLAVLFVAALAINWYLDTISPSPEPPPSNADEPDLYMVEGDITQFDDTGRVVHRITANRFTHYPVTDVTDLVAPAITINQPDGPPWRIAALEGRIHGTSRANEEVIDLWEQVVAERVVDEERYRIESDALTIVPAKDFVETDAKVTITTGSQTTVAVGMKAYLEPGRFSFASAGTQRVETIIRGPERGNP